MEFQSLIIPALSATIGGTMVGWIAKVLIQKWIDNNEKSHERWGKSIQDMMIQLTRIEEQVKTFQRTEQLAREQDRVIAVVQAQIGELRVGLNNVGAKVREIQA